MPLKAKGGKSCQPVDCQSAPQGAPQASKPRPSTIAPLPFVTASGDPSNKFDKVMGTNLKGALFTVQPAWRLLEEGASVILIGSTASVDAAPSMSLYGAAKAGLRAFT